MNLNGCHAHITLYVYTQVTSRHNPLRTLMKVYTGGLHIHTLASAVGKIQGLVTIATHIEMQLGNRKIPVTNLLIYA